MSVPNSAMSTKAYKICQSFKGLLGPEAISGLLQDRAAAFVWTDDLGDKQGGYSVTLLVEPNGVPRAVLEFDKQRDFRLRQCVDYCKRYKIPYSYSF